MQLYSYYTDVPDLKPDDELRLSILWRERWAAVGIDPVILSEHHAAKHPLYGRLLEAVSKRPTVNPKPYEAACFLRWLALAQVGGGFMADLDVMPYLSADGFLRDGIFSELTGRMMGNLHIYQSRGVCPSLVFAMPDTIEQLAEVFIEGKLGRRDQGGREHWSDQYVVEDLVAANTDWVETHDKVICYSCDGWEKAPIVHYANAYTAKLGPRWQSIPTLRT